MAKHAKKFAKSVLIALIGASFVSTPAFSQLCDADIENMIKNNALAQAHRQVVVGEAIIAKPDSLLQYSCFDQRVKYVAQDLARLFSNSEHWRNTKISTSGGGLESESNPKNISNLGNISFSVFMGRDHLDNIVDDMILEGLESSYIEENYDHSFLGGRLTEQYNFSDDVSGAGSVCDAMKVVFEAAQCRDMDDQLPFMKLSDFAASDPRARPRRCDDQHALNQEMVNRATNVADIQFDRLSNTYLDRMTVGANGAQCAASVPIETGVRVKYTTYNIDIAGNRNVDEQVDYAEKICLNPGCYFVPPNTCRAKPQ